MQNKQDETYPSKQIKYKYGIQQEQYAKHKFLTPPFDAKGKKFIQQLCGKFLFLCRVVNSTLLCTVIALAAWLSTLTKDTLSHAFPFLDYVTTQEEDVLTFNSSNMIMVIHSNAIYCSKPKAWSRADLHFFLSSDITIPPNNGAILKIAHIIEHINWGQSCNQQQNNRERHQWEGRTKTHKGDGHVIP